MSKSVESPLDYGPGLGFSALRTVTDVRPILEAQSLLDSEFGDAFRPAPPDQPPSLIVIGPKESARALYASSAGHDDLIGTASAISAAIQGLQKRFSQSLASEGRGFKVRLLPAANTEGQVFLRLRDKGLISERVFVTKAINKALGTHYSWGYLRPVIQIGSLASREAANDISSFDGQRRFSVPLGHLVFSRPRRKSRYEV